MPPWSACGMIMDLIKVPYRQAMRLYIDRPDIEVPGRWMFCPPGAKPIPFYHLYASAGWDEDTIPYEDFGDIRMDPFKSIANDPIPGVRGDQFCGDQRMWEEGCTFSEAGVVLVSQDDLLPCCAADIDRRGGDGDGGTAIQARSLWQDGPGGDEDDGQAHQVLGGVQLGQGGDSDDGVARQVRDSYQLGAGGDVDDGLADQVLGDWSAGPGGDSEGESARQVRDGVQLGHGGDSEDGLAPQVLNGWQAGLGGDSDGGTAEQDADLGQVAEGGDGDGDTAAQVRDGWQRGDGTDADDGSAKQVLGDYTDAQGGDSDDGVAEQDVGGGGIETECCPDREIPEELTATINADGCAAIDDKVVTLTYDEANDWWEGTVPGTDPACYVTFGCRGAPPHWKLRLNSGAPSAPDSFPASEQCDPFEVVFAFIGHGGCCSGPVFVTSVTVTE